MEERSGMCVCDLGSGSATCCEEQPKGFLDKINNRQQKFPSFHGRRDESSELKNQAIKNHIIISGERDLAPANNNRNYNNCYQNNSHKRLVW
jgi:hypothetical protein